MVNDVFQLSEVVGWWTSLISRRALQRAAVHLESEVPNHRVTSMILLWLNNGLGAARLNSNVVHVAMGNGELLVGVASWMVWVSCDLWVELLSFSRFLCSLYVAVNTTINYL